jgi:hypothetical protein
MRMNRLGMNSSETATAPADQTLAGGSEDLIISDLLSLHMMLTSHMFGGSNVTAINMANLERGS